MTQPGPFQLEYDPAAVVELRPRGQAFTLLAPPRFREHYEAREYEPFTARLLRQVLRRCRLFVDVGAHVGFFSLLAARHHPDLEVLAFEPTPESFALLLRNLERNRAGNVTAFPCAASDADGTASFHLAAASDNCGFHPHPHAPPLRQIEVPTRALDQVLAGREPAPTLVKVDTDGHELAVLRGLEKTLARLTDLTLLVEFNPKMQRAAGHAPEDLLKELDRLGFAAFLLDEEKQLPRRLAPDADCTRHLSAEGFANLYCPRKDRALSVCCFAHSTGMGGAERSLLELVHELVADHGALCTVVVPGKGSLWDALPEIGAARIEADYPWWCDLIRDLSPAEARARLAPGARVLLRELLPILADLAPDVCLTQTLVIPWGAAAAALLGRPHVWSVCEYGERDHGLRFFQPFAEVTRDIAAASHLVYTNSDGVREALFGDRLKERGRTLYRHVPAPPEDATAGPTGLWRCPGAFRLGLFGTVSEGKGQADAIAALGRLVAAGRDVELLIAGARIYPEYDQRLEEVIARHQLVERVRFTGVLKNPFPAMRECDAVLVCSRSEAFGRVAVEAMLLGKPVIYAEAGGPAEFMQPGRTGLPYPPGDDAALAGQIAALMNHPPRRASLAETGRRFARQRFSRAAYGGEVFHALLELARHAPPPARMPPLLQPLVDAAALEEVAAARAAQARVESALEQAMQEQARLRAEVEATRVQVETWRGRAENSQRRAEAAQAELSRSFAALDSARGEARRLQGELNEARHAQEGLGIQLDSNAATLASTRAELDAARQAVAAADQRERRANAELAALRASLAWRLSRPLRDAGASIARARETAFRAWVRLHPTRAARRLRAEAKLLQRSGIFDPAWYLHQPAAPRDGRPDPVLHYLTHGWRAGLDPNPLFDGAFYLARNPDVAEDGMNPLVHYLRHGATEGRDPHPLFDTDWYLAQYPDVAKAGFNPLAHYLAHGAAEGRSPGPDFDAQAYLDANPDVRASGMNPLAHYRWHGQAEGRLLRPEPPPSLPVFRLPAAASNRPRVVFISGEPHTPGHDYRARMYADALATRGFDTRVVPLDQQSGHLPFVADVLVIWRAAWKGEIPAVVAAARGQGAKVVFDVDDLMFDPALARSEIVDGIRSQGFAEPAIAELYRQMQQTLLAADFCTATTEPLASAMRRFQKATFVLPNGFDELRYRRSREAVPARQREGDDGLIRIGYAGGSRTHQRDFALAAPAVARVLREHPECRLVLFRLEAPTGHLECVDAHEFPDLVGLESRIEWRPFVPVRELPFELARFDINLAPLEPGNPFCEAKSELKYFEAALVDVPTIASPTQPYAAAMRDGETGFLAGETEAWYAALKRLVTEPELRREMGRAALLDVLWRFGPERRAERAAAVFTQIIEGESAHSAQQFELELHRAAAARVPAPDCAERDVVFSGGAGGWSEVAVVMPLHNYAGHVVEALESVRAQTLPAKSLVVVEDGSTDDSLRVAEEWLRGNAAGFTRATLLKNRANSGLARTRNAGFAFADAPFILALDADNLLEPHCLERSLEALRGSGAAVAFGTIQEFGDSHGTRSAAPWQAARFVGGNYVDAMALLRRSAWAAVGGYRRMAVTGWEDYDLWCRFVEAGLHGVWIPETLSRYRAHGRSMLRTRTELAGNRRRLADEMRRLHPWVDPAVLAGQEDTVIPAAPELPPLPPPATPTASAPPLPTPTVPPPRSRDRRRLEEMLPLLRCPETGQPLKLVAEDTLATLDGHRHWPLVDWRPIFFGEVTAARRFPDEHLSNPVPDRALRLVEGLKGPVLNMSAGGTRAWLPQGVELETAIFRNTDLVGDAHALPFADGVFEAVLAINAFEHYREPDRVVAEIRRVLKPGGQVFIHTAFLQPLHEPPWHFFNCTRFGLRQWFRDFELVDLCVSENFNPIYALAWQADELLGALRAERGPEAAAGFGGLAVRDVAAFWNQPACQRDARWAELRKLSQEAQDRLAAGFEFIGRKPGP